MRAYKASYYREHRDVMIAQSRRSQARRSQQDPERVRRIARDSFRAKRAEFVAQVRPLIEQLLHAGLTYAAIAEELHRRDLRTQDGHKWTALCVRYIIEPPNRYRRTEGAQAAEPRRDD